MNLQEWLEVATRGLKPAQQERIALEIKQHLEDAEAYLTQQGVLAEEAQQRSLEGLGDPLVASRAFLAMSSRPFVWQSLATLTYLMLSFPLGIAYFVLLITGFAVGLSLVWTWIGIPILALTFGMAAVFSALERSLAASLLGVYVARRPVYTVSGKGFWARAKAHISDKGTWLDVSYMFLRLPLGVAAFSLALLLWVLPLSLIAMPFAMHFAPDVQISFPDGWFGRGQLNALNGWVIALFGALLLPLCLHLLNLLASQYGLLAQYLLGNGAKGVSRPLQNPNTLQVVGALLVLILGAMVYLARSQGALPIP